MYIKIGSWHCSFSGTVKSLPDLVVPFVVQSLPQPEFSLHSLPASDIDQPSQAIFIADKAWSLWYEQSHFVWTFHAPDQILARLEVGDAWPRHAVLHHQPFLTPTELFFDYPLGQLMLIEYAADHAGVILHACAVRNNDHTLLFIGPPEVGKSTMARLWAAEGYTVLSDDRIFVQQVQDQLWAYGTPWHSSAQLVNPFGAPIQALFFLQHGNSNAIRSLTPAEIIRRLLPETHLPLWNAHRTDLSLNTVDRLVQQIPAFELAFAPSSQVIDDVRKLFC